jgi:hypothetical protein
MPQKKIIDASCSLSCWRRPKRELGECVLDRQPSGDAPLREDGEVRPKPTGPHALKALFSHDERHATRVVPVSKKNTGGRRHHRDPLERQNSRCQNLFNIW